jgi:hypothetical protein
MITFPLLDCCELLAIDPKTLRHWLRQAMMSLHIHPTDARVKCLTLEQVQRLALLHGRALKPHEACLTISPGEASPLEAQQKPSHPQMISSMTRVKTASAVVLEDGDLSQKLSHLEAQVVALQQQLVLLTQELLQVREVRTEHCLSPLDTPAQRTGEPGISRHKNLATSMPVLQDGGRPLHPAEQRARFLVLPPLIEYGAAGTYVVISSQEGELPLIADSPEWFEWFRTLSSFRFVGQCGRFSACRAYKHRPTRMWQAYRTIHQHDYKHYLGLSEHLTVAHLEQMAARFQSYVE